MPELRVPAGVSYLFSLLAGRTISGRELMSFRLADVGTGGEIYA